MEESDLRPGLAGCSRADHGNRRLLWELRGLAPALMEDTRPESLQEVGTCCAHSRAAYRHHVL